MKYYFTIGVLFFVFLISILIFANKDKKIIEVKVSPCDKAVGLADTHLCFAKSVCGENQVKDFVYEGSWSDKFSFNCIK